MARRTRESPGLSLGPAIANSAWFEVDLRETSMMVTMVKMPECIDEMVDTCLGAAGGQGDLARKVSRGAELVC